jgi:uroporphyrinogen decarboxylase
MQRMTHRERIRAALSHQQPDRVPIDLGTTPVTGIAAKAYDRVVTFLGLELEPTQIYDRAGQIAIVDPAILELFGIDTRGIKPGMPDGGPNIESADEEGYTDEWGLVRKKPAHADTYFVANAPLDGEISTQDILNYRWPTPEDPGRIRGLREQALSLCAKGDWAIVLSLPGSFIQHSQLMRGFSSWYLDAAADPARLAVLLDQVMEIQLATCGYMLDAVGDLVDVVFTYDDLAMQDRLIVSPATYRKLLEPRLRKFIEYLRSKTSAKIVHHTDGAVVPILNSLADMGIDAINPVQVSAKGMGDTGALKAEFGDRLAFWGAIDTQSVLPFGTPNQVRIETQLRIDHLNQSGGYVLCSAHNIQSDVPAENVIAMYETALGKRLVEKGKLCKLVR